MADDIIIKGPDGSSNKFPAGTPDDVITRAMRETFPPPPPSQLQPGFLSDDPRDWQKPSPKEPKEKSRARARGILVPLAEGESGKIEPAVPSLIAGPAGGYERARKTLGTVGRPSELGEAGGNRLIGDVLEYGSAAGLPIGQTGFPMAYRQNLQRARAAEEAAGGQYGPHIPGSDRILDWIMDKGKLTEREAVKKTAQELGVGLPRAATGTLLEQVGAGGLSATPLGTPLIKQSKAAAEQLEDAVSGVAHQMGSGTRTAAGEGVRDEVIAWLEKGSQEEASKIFAPIDKVVADGERIFGEHAVQPLDFTRTIVEELTEQAAKSHLPPPTIINKIQAALDSEGLSYEGLQRLRTEIGDMLSGKIVPEPGMNKRAIEAIYAGLSQDLEALFLSFAYPTMLPQEAKALWKGVNEQFATQIAAKREAIGKILGVDGKAPSELIVDRIQAMAGAKAGADIARMEQLKSVMGEQGWNEIGSAVIAKLGQTKDGMSVAQFRTQYEGMSEPAKELLFGSGPGSHKDALDKIALVGQAAENLQKWGNPSGTARGMTSTTAALGLIASPYATLGALIGDYAMSWVLSRPVTAHITADWMEKSLAYAVNKTPETKANMLASQRLLMEMVAKPVQTPDEAKALPDGTLVKTPEGELRKTKGPRPGNIIRNPNIIPPEGKQMNFDNLPRVPPEQNKRYTLPGNETIDGVVPAQ